MQGRRRQKRLEVAAGRRDADRVETAPNLDRSDRAERFAPELELLLLALRAERPEADATRLAELAARPGDGKALVRLATEHGVAPLAAAALLEGAGAALAEPLRAELAAVRERHTMFALFLAEELKRTLGVLAEAGIPAVAFKGPSLAERCYTPPSARAMGDLDILVPHEQILAGRDALLGPGGYTMERSMSTAADARLLASRTKYNYTRFMSPGKRLVLELHWDVVPRAFHLSPDWRRLWREARPAEFRGAATRAFAPEDELFIYALHGARHRWGQLKWVADIDRFLRAGGGDGRGDVLDEERALRRARERGGERCVLLAAGLAERLLGTPLGEAFEAGAAPPEVARLIERAVAWLRRGPDASKARDDFGARLAFQLGLRERLRDRAGYLVDYAAARFRRDG